MKNTENLLSETHETVWQEALKSYFASNNENYFVSQKGKSVTIMSLGEHNLFEGPDFTSACIMLNGQLTVGDIEFHKKSSNWLQHKHSANDKYKNVILHMVLLDNKPFPANFETIIIEKNQLAKFLKPKTPTVNYDYAAYEDFKQFALLRLNRRTIDISQLLMTKTLKETYTLTVINFTSKYEKLQKRPTKLNFSIDNILNELENSFIFDFIENINDKKNEIQTNFEKFLLSKMNYVNNHFKLELLTNSILPLCFCIANNHLKTELLMWYLTAKTKCSYGILLRKYPQISQKYIWLQQGMLEHRRFPTY
jgi:hypothetical protein